jgi:hypothetical protein
MSQFVIRSRGRSGLQAAAKNLGARWPMVCVWGLVIILLGYVLCSVLNPEASLQYTFTPGYPLASGVEIDYL